MGWRQLLKAGRGQKFLWGRGRQQSMELLPIVAVTNANQPRDRDQIIDEYEGELKKARLWARIIGVLHKFSQFLAFCNLTWATVALLGAFLPSLLALDFAFVTCLLFLEAGRVASASFFLRFLMRPLAYGSQDPKKINHGEDGQYPASRRVRCSSDLVQYLLIAPGFVVPILGHVLLHDYSGILNLNSSLRIFYSFVAFNSSVALINVICSAQAFKALNNPPEQSILRYFDTVLDRAMSSDLMQADVFEFFGFAYEMLGAEFRRNVQPEAVAKNHKRLIHYLHAHRLGHHALKTFLEAEDPFVRLAAVNIVGFWSDRVWDVGVAPGKELKLPQDLLKKLADNVVTGQLGWATVNSFSALAGTPGGAKIVAETRTSSNIRVPDQLAGLVDDSSNQSLSPVRALVELYEQYCVNEQQPPSLFNEERKLVSKLEKLGREAKVHRLRVMAAYLLLLMGKGYDTQMVLAIHPIQDTYWFTAEISMLKLLLSHIPDTPRFQIPEFAEPDPRKPDAPRKRFERKGADINAPSWANPHSPHQTNSP